MKEGKEPGGQTQAPDTSSRRHGPGMVAAALLAVLLAAGIVHLFALRFAASDIYPPYSSLRADPLGAKIFYRSLEACPDIAVSRNYRPIEELEWDPPAAVFFLGTAVPENLRLPAETIARMQRFCRDGGRLVVTFLPRQVRRQASRHKAGKTESKEEQEPGQDAPKQDAPAPNTIALEAWWGVEFRDAPLSETGAAGLTDPAEHPDLPRRLSCHSTLCFAGLGDDWRTVYERDGRPVLVERRVGRGAIVLSALSYFASNEAMQAERQPALLAWLVGDRRAVVFDEQHHGLLEQRGLAALLRKHRLHGLLAALLALAALFVWQQATRLVPACPAARAQAPGELAEGKTASAGLVNLLRRHIPAHDLPGICLDEWEQSLGRSAADIQAKTARMRTVVEAERARAHAQRDPVAACNAMARILKERQAPAGGEGRNA